MGLFGFGKKKDEAKVEEAAPAVDLEAVKAQVEEATAKLEGLEGKARAEVLNEIGKLQADAGNIDEAIKAFEESLEADHVMGKASATLVKLYNKKRAEAAAAKDDEAIKYYLAKVNEMLAISKNQLRGMQ